MHEIVTLQFGQQSNYLGTHFWNTQESYFTYPPEPESPVDHDVLFRPGIAPDGSDTYTPRTLIYDLKGAFGSMRKINALYEPEDTGDVSQSGVWSSKPIVQRLQPIPQAPYQAALDAGIPPPPLSASTVRYWSDYSHLFYHPRSLVQLSEFEVNDTLMPFEKWDVGMELFEKLEREVDLVDRDLRPFIEECDGLQGIQMITGIDDAWGGWASGWLERLRDEYGKTSIWTWGIGDQGGNMATPREKRHQQIANSARSLNVMAEQSSVCIPLSSGPIKVPSYLQIDLTSPWNVGALQSVALDTITLPSRLRAGRSTLQQLEEIINSTGQRRLAKLELSVADPDVLSARPPSNVAHAEKVRSSVSTERSDDVHDDQIDFDMDLFTKEYRASPVNPAKREHIFGRLEVDRGDWSLPSTDNIDPHDRFNDGPVVQRYAAPLLFPRLSSFPSIFDVGSGHGEKFAVHAALSTSTAVAGQLRMLEGIVGRLTGVDEREGLCNGLQTLAEEYDEGWDSGSGSDMDD